jgi:plastocyanin
MRAVFHTLLGLCPALVFSAPLEIQFVAVDGKPVSATVVMLRSVDASRRPAAPVSATIEQEDLAFIPHVLVVPVGSTISFPNNDTVSHQVYSFSPARSFKLPLYRGTPPPVTFDRAGVVTLGCNIHDQMRAYVYVVDAQHSGRTDDRGNWSAPDVQPGEYQLEIWHPRSRVQRPVAEQRITVGAEGARLVIRAATALKLRSESQVPANWDAY